MTTATAGASSRADRFTMSVRALKSAQQLTTPELCEALHMSKATFYERMNGNVEWSLNEAMLLAELFQTPLEAMVHGIGARQNRRASDTPTQPRLSPKLAASNTEPTQTAARSGHLSIVRG